MSHIRFAILAAVSSALLGCANSSDDAPGAGTANDVRAQHTHEQSESSICAAPMHVTEGAGLYIEDLKSIAGKLKLVRADFQVNSEYVDGTAMAFGVTATLSPKSNTWNPHVKTRVSCKDMDSTPNMEASSSFNAPLVINANNGNLTGNAMIRFSAHGEHVKKQDKVEAFYALVPEHLDITGFIAKLRREGDVSIHKSGQNGIEIRFSRKKETNEKSSVESLRLQYVGQPR